MSPRNSSSAAPSKPAASTSPAPAASSIPAGVSNGLFGPSVQPDKPAPLVEREHLAAPLIVRHQGTRRVGTANGGSTIHSFALGVGRDEPWFSLWGSANLNSQLRKVKPGAILQLRYAGQLTNADDTPGAHQWEVRPTTAALAQVERYLESEDQKARMAEMRQAIEWAAEKDRERRDLRRAGDNPAGPPHDDDDLPF